MTDFEKELQQRVLEMQDQKELIEIAAKFMLASTTPKYSYNYMWSARPIIQYPQDIVAMQELIWKIKPDLIIETGIAHGGSLVFSASMLAQLDINEAIELGVSFDPKNSNRKVLGIDIDIRAHNLKAIQEHPMSSRIQMIQGSSIDYEVIEQVRNIAKNYKCIMVCLDSNHTHDHVLSELQAYADLTSIGSYCCVFDTIIEDFPLETYPDRPWGPGNNPKTAVYEFLKSHSEFEIDKTIQKNRN